MGMYGGRTVPFSLYPADVIERFFRGKRSGGSVLETLIKMKIEDYRSRHEGKSPARIFITVGMYVDIFEQIHCDMMTSAYPENKLFGVPVSLIEGKESQIYLSDEEVQVWNE